MIERVLPPGVAFAERFSDVPVPGLFPAEEAVIARAVPRRRSEFATGRWCARRALADLGHPPVAILPGVRGAPGWPPGFVGSITHCAGYRAAVAARADDFAAVAVDAEPALPLPEGVLAAISLPDERAAVEQHEGWDRLLFCVKEAVYKLWSPLTGRWLDFEQARVELRPDGTWRAEVLAAGPLTSVDGRWLSERGLLIAAAQIARH